MRSRAKENKGSYARKHEKIESVPAKFRTAQPGLGEYNRRDTLVSPQNKK